MSARMLSSSFLEVLCFWASLFAIKASLRRPGSGAIGRRRAGDKEVPVRGAAAKALGALGSPESIPKLQNLLAD
jgi:hypothetical protein